MRIVIVGGVAGGASAAARARRLSETAEIIVIERGAHPSFANCGMPYYIGGEIEDRDKLLVAPKQMLIDRHRLDIRTEESVEAINRERKVLTVRWLVDGSTYEQPYDKLILSPGASPLRPPIPGVDLPSVYTLRDLRDADVLHELASQQGRVVVVGAGFIGLELAENLVRRGVQTTIVELADQVLPPWDREMTTPIAERITSRGVELLLNDSAKGFQQQGNELSVELGSGRTLSTDHVVLCVGVRPENSLARDANLEVGPRGGIRVNQHMQTSDPDIYAVGDAVETRDAITGDPIQVPLAGPANRQGRVAADHIFGRPSVFRGIQGTAIVGVFGMTAAMTGLSEKALRRTGQDYEKVYLHPTHHASYYPGAEPMTIKLLFEPSTGQILGSQIVGALGVDKRIDVLAIAIQAGMTVFDLEEAELAYAPQYGSAKDPINMAGFVAANIVRGDVQVAHAEDHPETLVLDVRSKAEFDDGHIPGALNIPLEELRERVDELEKNQPIVTCCGVGQRGYLAARILKSTGHDVANLSGGYATHRHHRGQGAGTDL